MTKEIWKDVVGYEGKYKVSNLGNVMSYNFYRNKKPRLLKLLNHNCGYYTVNLSRKSFLVHRLVAEAFIPNPNNYPQIDHINTIRNDNRVENLRWCTKTDNMNNSLTKVHLHNAVMKRIDGLRNKVVSEETKRKISESKRKSEKTKTCHYKTVYQYDKDGNFIDSFVSGLHAAHEVGVRQCSIYGSCSGRCGLIKGYFWRYYKVDNLFNKV